MHKKRLMELLVEIAVGIAVVIVALLCARHGPFRWMPPRKWLAFAIITSVVFGVPVWWYRECLRRPTFWTAFAGLLVLHTAAYSILLGRVKELSPLLGAASYPLEWLVIFPILRIVGRPASEGRKIPS
jgi:hypothetical protein